MTMPPPVEVAAELRAAAAQMLDLAERLAPLPPTPLGDATAGGLLVVGERARQVSEEGYDPKHDAAHAGNELAWAAFCYLERAAQDRLPQEDPSVPHVWPQRRQDWKPKASRIRNLTVAAALVVAEIDARLARGEAP